MMKSILLLLALCGSAQAGTQDSGMGNAFVFKSTVVVGASAYTVVLDTKAFVIGGFSIVGSTSASGATTTNFTSALASVTYRLHGNLTTTGGTFTPYIRINSDSGTNYTYQTNCQVVALNIASGGDTARAQVYLDDENNGSATGSPLFFDVWLETRAGDTKSVDGWFRLRDLRGGGTSKEVCSGGFTYTGASVFSSFSFNITAASYTGYLSVYQERVSSHP